MNEDPFEEDPIKKVVEERNKKRRQRELRDLKDILESVQGRRFLWRILEEGRIFASCYDRNALDMANNEGKRDMALMILKDIKKVSFTVLGIMERESESDKENERAEIKRLEKKTEE